MFNFDAPHEPSKKCMVGVTSLVLNATIFSLTKNERITNTLISNILISHQFEDTHFEKVVGIWFRLASKNIDDQPASFLSNADYINNEVKYQCGDLYLDWNETVKKQKKKHKRKWMQKSGADVEILLENDTGSGNYLITLPTGSCELTGKLKMFNRCGFCKESS